MDFTMFLKIMRLGQSPSLSIVFSCRKTQWLVGSTTLIFASAFTALLNCAEGRDDEIEF